MDFSELQTRARAGASSDAWMRLPYELLGITRPVRDLHATCTRPVRDLYAAVPQRFSSGSAANTMLNISESEP